MDTPTADKATPALDWATAALDDFSTEGGRLSVPLHVARGDDGRLRVAVDGHEQVLGRGEWSAWMGLTLGRAEAAAVRQLAGIPT